MVPFSAATSEEDVIEDLQSDLRMMKDKYDIEVEINLSANDPIKIDQEVCVSDAVSNAYIIEGIKGQENES